MQDDMVPIIIVSRNETAIDQYLKQYIKDNKLSPLQIFKIYPKSREMGIDEVRQLRRMLIVTSSIWRVFVLYSFGFSTFESQNALLKTLEEKIQDNQFILVCENEQQLIPTIRSRSNTMFLDRGKVNISSDPKTVLFVQKIIGSSKKLDFLNSDLVQGLKNDEAQKVIDQIILYFQRKVKEADLNSIAVIRKALRFKVLLANNNLNAQLAIDNLLIYIYKKYRMKQ